MGSNQVSGAVAHLWKHRLGARRGDEIADLPPDAGYRRPQARRWMRLNNRPTLRAVGTFDVCSNAAANSDLPCFLKRQTEAAAFALPGRYSGVTRVISARRQKHLPPLPPTT